MKSETPDYSKITFPSIKLTGKVKGVEKIFRHAARGDLRAMITVVFIYRGSLGTGIIPDEAKVREWTEKVAAVNSVAGMILRSIIDEEGVDIKIPPESPPVLRCIAGISRIYSWHDFKIGGKDVGDRDNPHCIYFPIWRCIQRGECNHFALIADEESDDLVVRGNWIDARIKEFVTSNYFPVVNRYRKRCISDHWATCDCKGCSTDLTIEIARLYHMCLAYTGDIFMLSRKYVEAVSYYVKATATGDDQMSAILRLPGMTKEVVASLIEKAKKCYRDYHDLIASLEVDHMGVFAHCTRYNKGLRRIVRDLRPRISELVDNSI